MAGKRPQTDPGGTYVLDDEDLEELQDSSLSGVMRDVTDSLPRPKPDDEGADTDSESDSKPDLGYLIPDD